MLKVKYKTNFQDIWLENEEYKPWLQKMENNPCMVRYKVCIKYINIAVHGSTALHTHAEGSKHKERLPKVGSQSFFKKAAEGSVSPKQPEYSCKQSFVNSCTNRTLVINAKIMWNLDVVMSKYSFHLNLIKNELFATIFSDSEETKAFSCGKTKCSYLENYGIASYFLELLNSW